MAENKWATTFYHEQDLKSIYMNEALGGIVKPGIYNLDAYIYVNDSSQICLHIGKGSTFVFAHNISKTSDSKWEKDYKTNIGDSAYVIKCVASEDMDDIKIWSLGAGEADNEFFNSSKLYVMALMSYNTNSLEESLLSDSEPTFGIYSYDSAEGYTYIADKSDTKFFIIEGKESNSNTLLDHLNLGAIYEVNSGTGGYHSSGNWIDNGNIRWIENHVFTSAGSYDLRQGGEAFNSTIEPSIIIGKSLSNIYLDLKKFYVNSSVYDMSSDPQSIFISEPTSLNTRVQVGKHYLFDKSKELSDVSVSNGDIVTDMIYLKVNSRNVNQKVTEDTLKDIYSKGLESLKVDSVFYKVSSNDISSVDNDVLNIKSGKCIKNFFNSESTGIMPLDASVSTQERLLSFIENYPIVDTIVDAMRQNNIIDGSECNAIIPVALVLRQMGSNDTFIDGISTKDGKFHPCNVLNLLSLQNNMNKINTISLKAEEVFNRLSIID